MTGTNPQEMRFHLLEAAENECVTVRINYEKPNERLIAYYQVSLGIL